MIAATINHKLTTLFRNLDKPDKLLVGEDSWAKYDSSRERDSFERLSDDPTARQGTYDVSSTHHPFSPPYRSQVQVSGDLTNGTVSQQHSLFLELPVRTTGDPTFLTTSQTTFTPEGATKLEAVEGPNGTTARRLFSDYDEPQKDYVAEYFIAK
jgi:hypothetical protein